MTDAGCPQKLACLQGFKSEPKFAISKALHCQDLFSIFCAPPSTPRRVPQAIKLSKSTSDSGALALFTTVTVVATWWVTMSLPMVFQGLGGGGVHKIWWGKPFLLTVGAFLLTVKLLCLQSLKALIRRTFPL